MYSEINKISLVSLMWILPLLELFHNFEELMTMGSFWGAHEEIKSLPFYSMMQATDLQFAVSVGILTALVFVVTFIAVKHPQKGNWMNLFILFSALIFVNALIHIIQSLIFQSYVPGLLTALLLTVPYSVILFYRIFQEGLINRARMGVMLVLGLILQVPIIIAALWIGKVLIPV